MEKKCSELKSMSSEGGWLTLAVVHIFFVLDFLSRRVDGSHLGDRHKHLNSKLIMHLIEETISTPTNKIS